MRLSFLGYTTVLVVLSALPQASMATAVGQPTNFQQSPGVADGNGGKTGSIVLARLGQQDPSSTVDWAGTQFSSIRTGAKALSLVSPVVGDPRDSAPVDELWQGNAFKPYAPNAPSSALGTGSGRPGSDVLLWIVAGLVLLGLIPGFGLMSAQRRQSASPRPSLLHRRIAVDTSAFVRPSAPLRGYDEDMPRMRDVGQAPFWEEPVSVVPDDLDRRQTPSTEEYRLFRLNSTGLVDQAESGLFSDVDAALRRAAVFGEGSPVEVWHGRRKITVVADNRPAKALTDYIFREGVSRSGAPLTRHEFASDAAAMAHALKLSQGQGIEVRCHDRLVGTVRSGVPA